jgi:hypothetical protein
MAAPRWDQEERLQREFQAQLAHGLEDNQSSLRMWAWVFMMGFIAAVGGIAWMLFKLFS